MHVRSGLQTTPPSSTITSTQSTTSRTTTSTETFAAIMGEPINIHNKGKLNKEHLLAHLAMNKNWMQSISVDSSCPEKCLCVDDYKLINCSTRQLHEIPENLPKNVETLDLSHNQLKHLNVGALKDCKSLRELLLANNQIETIIDKAVSTLKFIWFCCRCHTHTHTHCILITARPSNLVICIFRRIGNHRFDGEQIECIEWRRIRRHAKIDQTCAVA